MNNPVLFLGYNRISCFKRVLYQNLSNLKRRRIYLSLDGPKCFDDAKFQQKIINLFKRVLPQTVCLTRNSNLGLQKAIPDGINWFFLHEEKGLIIEDDIYFKNEFLKCCDFFLNNKSACSKYAMFCGYNPIPKKQISNILTIFETKYHSIWGWATTRKQWKSFNSDFVHLPFYAFYKIFQMHFNNRFLAFAMAIFLVLTKQKKIISWDFIWLLSLCKIKKTNLIACYNLTKNFGNDNLATNTLPNFKSININIKNTKKISFDYLHKSDEFNKAFVKGLDLSLFKIFRSFLCVLFPRWFVYFIKRCRNFYIEAIA